MRGAGRGGPFSFWEMVRDKINATEMLLNNKFVINDEIYCTCIVFK